MKKTSGSDKGLHCMSWAICSSRFPCVLSATRSALILLLSPSIFRSASFQHAAASYHQKLALWIIYFTLEQIWGKRKMFGERLAGLYESKERKEQGEEERENSRRVRWDDDGGTEGERKSKLVDLLFFFLFLFPWLILILILTRCWILFVFWILFPSYIYYK